MTDLYTRLGLVYADQALTRCGFPSSLELGIKGIEAA